VVLWEEGELMGKEKGKVGKRGLRRVYNLEGELELELTRASASATKVPAEASEGRQQR
jgi:hypothetical protein